MAAAGRPRVSSTIKPRCDAARSPHPAHIHLHLPAHSRSSDLRQYQVSSKTISARARGDARVAASGRVSGVRRPSSFGPGYPGSPPSDWAGSARTIVDAEDDAASFPSWTSPVARFAASERVYILGMPAHTALSGGNGRPGKIPNQSSLSLAVPADSPISHIQSRRQKQHQTKARCLPPRTSTPLSPSSPSAVSSAWAWPSAPESP